MTRQTLNFYGYPGHAPLGKEPVGGDSKCIWRDLKTVRGARRRAHWTFGGNYRLYTFTNFYDNSTFREVTP